MSRPTISVWVAFNDTPFTASTSLTWTEITSDLRLAPDPNGAPITIRRGRSNELSRVEAGQLTLTLSNTARQYDPEYASGPYYPNIKPMKRIQVRALWNSVTYYLFTGYVQAWTPEYPGRDAVVRVRAIDALSTIARATITITSIPPGELAHLAARSALLNIGWPVAVDYTYSVGQTRIAPGTYANLNALQYIQNIADTEDALVLVRHDGKIEFQDRYYRINNATSAATFDPSSATLPYESVQISFDDEVIYNDVQITRSGGALQEATDTTSQSEYGPRTLSKSGLYFSTDNEALAMAQWFLLRYRDPRLRLPQLVLNGDLAPATLWPQVLNGNLSRKITVVVRPPNGGTISKDVRIENISHSIDRNAWRTTWGLSLANDDQFWILGTSQLDSTTILAF